MTKHPVEKPLRTSPCTGLGHILVVEDDDLVRTYLKLVLERAGYAVTVVNDGAEALPVIRSGSLDLIISDVMMPNMNGADLLREIVRIGSNTKIIFITGYSGDILGNLGLPPGETVLLQKPVLRDALIAAVRETIA